MRDEADAAARGRVQRTVAVVVAVLVVLGAVVAFGVLGGAEDEPEGGTAGTTASGCTEPPAAPGTAAELELPDAAEAEGTVYEATLTTNCGDIVVRLDGTLAPQAVASFLQLARTGYWVDSPCHRLTTGESFEVLQCGDPTGTGTGGPGYGYGVENAPADGVYPRGSVAMARTSDPENGNGGQFFLVYGDTEIPDPDGYTVFGTVTAGLDIVDRVAAQGVVATGSSPTDGPPAAPISILQVAVTEESS
ncbi:peptidylprolyl isomerase [Phycicoccus sp. BSK3Z-2]|uniref:Peptidylprolyl isomerase n=1 Tax=Phycicoccus avicenniae TaxID=2828860 RepID=A0A941D6J1_9MICO|nr:peptidylprolyl isomerase [Phycicoccus avicenniae]